MANVKMYTLIFLSIFLHLEMRLKHISKPETYAIYDCLRVERFERIDIYFTHDFAASSQQPNESLLYTPAQFTHVHNGFS